MNTVKQNVAMDRNRQVEAKRSFPREVDDIESVVKEVSSIVAAYARQRPEITALFCVGIGFVLGWKLKPW